MSSQEHQPIWIDFDWKWCQRLNIWLHASWIRICVTHLLTIALAIAIIVGLILFRLINNITEWLYGLLIFTYILVLLVPIAIIISCVQHKYNPESNTWIKIRE